MTRFDYLIDKINSAQFSDYPFEHIYIDNFFNSSDFQEIINSTEVASIKAENDIDLIDILKDKGFEQIKFPGTANDIKSYLRWRQSPNRLKIRETCNSFGLVLRLNNSVTQIISELDSFLRSDKFNIAIAAKFNIPINEVSRDCGIQKYLDGYEISPHPDVRRKALTFMVNINPSKNSEDINFHTHYMKVKPEYDYLLSFWKGNTRVEREWMPWSWAQTIFQQTKNNSIVLFSPAENTIHAVKADYNHLTTQRTQLYGNLWFKETKADLKLEWPNTDLLIRAEKSVKIIDKIKHKLKYKIDKS